MSRVIVSGIILSSLLSMVHDILICRQWWCHLTWSTMGSLDIITRANNHHIINIYEWQKYIRYHKIFTILDVLRESTTLYLCIISTINLSYQQTYVLYIRQMIKLSYDMNNYYLFDRNKQRTIDRWSFKWIIIIRLVYIRRTPLILRWLFVGVTNK